MEANQGKPKKDRSRQASKAKRGGGSRFAAQSAEEIEVRNNRLKAFDASRQKRRGDGEDGDEDDDDDESGEEGAGAGAAATADGSAVAKASKAVAGLSLGGAQQRPAGGDDGFVLEEGGGDEDAASGGGGGGGSRRPRPVIETANPNASGVMSSDVGDGQPMSRREREDAEKLAAAERYRKRHEAGLTDEYKKDMKRLEEVKAKREEAAKKAEEAARVAAELEERNNKQREREKAKGGGATADKDDGGIPRLDKIAIKKMKPALLKEALKERGLDIQGTGKDLEARLLAYEEKR